MKTESHFTVNITNPNDPKNKDFLKIKEMFDRRCDSEELATIINRHLMVEYCMDKYLKAKYKNVRMVTDDLTFARKLDLIECDDMLYKGLKQFNKIRNKYTHEFKSLTESNISEIKKAILHKVNTPEMQNKEPIFYVDYFSLIVSALLVLNTNTD